MDEIIKKHRAMVAERLYQGFSPVHRDTLSKAQEAFDDIEKARVVRQDGDIHPNGKWVWSSQAAGGKGDWRVIKKQKGDNPAPAAKSPKEDAKPAEGAPKKSKLQDKVEGMSLEELEALQKMVAQAMVKKPAAKTEEKPAKVEEPEDDEDYAVDPTEDDDDGEGDELAYIASIVSKYEEGAEVEGVDIRDFGDVFLDFVTTSGEAACIKNDYLGDAVIVPLFDNEEIVERNKSILGIKSDLKGGYALFIGNNPPEFYKTIKEAAQWAGEAIKDGYYEQNYDEDGNELAKPKPNKPKLGEAPMAGAAEKTDEFISHIQSKYEGAKISKDGDIVDVQVPVVDNVKIDIQFNPSVGSAIAEWSGFGRSGVTSYESNVRNMSVGDLVPPVTSFIDKLIAKQKQVIAFNAHRMKSSKTRVDAKRDTFNAKEKIKHYEQLRKKYASAK